jgi:2-octaprenylphenol hydroxylase
VISDPDYDVVIVGAGIAGSALACALGSAGFRLALVEAGALAPPPAAVVPGAETGVGDFDARVSAITPASTRFLRDIGAWEKIPSDLLCPYQHMFVWDAEGTGNIDFHAAELDAPELGHIVENRVLTGALLASVGECQDITLLNPARVLGLEYHESRSPRLLLEDGRELSAHLLVAADGALSRVRELAGFNTREWDYGHHALVATVQTAQWHDAAARQRFMPTGPLAFLPLPSHGGRHFCSIVWSLEPELAQRLLELPDVEFLVELDRAIEHRLGDLPAVSTRHAFPLRQRHAVDYIKPGLALVGDAAHTIHPLAGQGINLGLRDVAVLAEELRLAAERGADPGSLEVLRRFQRRRKGENLLMMAAMDGFKRLFAERSLPLRWLRNTGMRLVGRTGPLKHQLMRHAMGLR